MTIPKQRYDIGSERNDLVLQIIKGVEHSIADKSYWKQICRDFTTLYSAQDTYLTLINLETMRPIIISTKNTESAIIHEYWSFDGDVSFTKDPLFQGSLKLTEGSIATNDDIIPTAELQESDYYKNFLSKIGVEKTLTSILINNAQYYAYLAVIRSHDDPDFLPQDKTLLEHLSPYIKLGLLAYLESEKKTSLTKILTNTWLGEYAFAVFQLNKSAQILQLNEYGQHLVEEKAQLSIVENKLSYEGDHNVATQFFSLIENSCNASKEKIPHQQLSSLEIDGTFFRLVVLPLKEKQILHSAELPACVVILQDRSLTEQVIDRSYLQMAFDFSKAELRIAEGLAHGLSLKEIAGASQNSIHTVRAQLKSIFAKTGLNSQSTLVGFLVDEASYQIPKRPGYKSSFQTFSATDLYDII